MAKPPRDLTCFGSSTYFVTASTWGRRPLLQSDRVASLFLDTLFRYRHDGRFLLYEFAIMPNHFHLLFTPIDIALERAMQLVKGRFSYRLKKELQMSCEVWERGYVDHRVRDSNDYQRHASYIQQNPVKAGLVSCPQDYPWSSAHAGFDLDPCPSG